MLRWSKTGRFEHLHSLNVLGRLSVLIGAVVVIGTFAGAGWTKAGGSWGIWNNRKATWLPHEVSKKVNALPRPLPVLVSSFAVIPTYVRSMIYRCELSPLSRRPDFHLIPSSPIDRFRSLVESNNVRHLSVGFEPVWFARSARESSADYRDTHWADSSSPLLHCRSPRNRPDSPYLRRQMMRRATWTSFTYRSRFEPTPDTKDHPHHIVRTRACLLWVDLSSAVYWRSNLSSHSWWWADNHASVEHGSSRVRHRR